MSSSTNDTLKHAAIGAVVSLVLFFLPFSPALGGALAGYLHGPDRTDGAKVGGLSGLFAAVPGSLALTFIGGFFIIAGPGARSGVLFLLVFFVVALFVTTLYGVALGAVGGFLGAFLNEEFDGPGSSTREVDRRDDLTAARGRTGDAPRDARTADAPREYAAADDDGPEPELVEFDEPVEDDRRT